MELALHPITGRPWPFIRPRWREAMLRRVILKESWVSIGKHLGVSRSRARQLAFAAAIRLARRRESLDPDRRYALMLWPEDRTWS